MVYLKTYIRRSLLQCTHCSLCLKCLSHFFYHFNQTKDLLRDGWCDFGALAASVWTTIRTRIYCSCKFYSERDISYVNILVSAIGSLGRRTKECLLGSNSLNIDTEKQPICSDACPCIIYNCTLLMNIMLHFFWTVSFAEANCAFWKDWIYCLGSRE